MTAAVRPMPRLMRFARAMEITTVVGIVLITLLAALGAYIPHWTHNIALAKLGQAGIGLPITPLGQVYAAIVLALPVGVMLYGLFAVRRMFREFARGQVFTETTARHLQTFAATVLAQAPLGPLTAAGISAALSVRNPPAERAITIAFSINDYFALLVGGVLFAAATIMREAARIAEENASFV